MECGGDSEFNDDSSSIDEKTKESILLMKKKMLRSHDLILQYNNKLKECERLKGDLCLSQEEAMKLKRESNANLAKVVKLEMLNAEYKKSQQDLERRIADKDIQIASDKCHLQQLVCKVDDIEDKHSEKLMEVELEKSSLEVKVKNLEQELKALRKSHLSEVNKLEKAINGLPPKPRKGTIKVVKDTKEIGVNTVGEPEPAKPVKPATAEKSVLTDEFYHKTDNPYPLFCDKCETSIEPSVEKICKIMTSHPPLLTEMLSPVRRRENPSANLSRAQRDSRSTDSNNPNFSTNPFRRVDLDSIETSIDFNRVDPVPRNFVSPINTTITSYQPTSIAPTDTVNPEIENLRRKVETLERRMKKRKRQKSAEVHPTNANCCGQSRSLNCCGHGQAHANQVPNLFANGQLDMMTEFWKRMTMFTNEPAPSLERPRKIKKHRKTKLRRLRKKEKLKNSKKFNNCGSTVWEIESENCETETNVDNSESKNSHILRIKPSEVESRESSPVKIVSDRSDESTEKLSYVETASNRASPVKVPDKLENNVRTSVCSFSDVEDANMDVESSNHEIVENSELSSKLPTSQIQNSSDGETTNYSQDTESAYFSHNSAGDETASISHETDSRSNCFDANFKTALPTEKSVSSTKKILRNSQKSSMDKSVSVCSDTDLSDAPAEEEFDADLQDRSATRKRKRSYSPKATKRKTRSKDSLFGKMRALKKNTVVGVAKTRSNVYQTRNRRKITNGAEAEEHDGETVNNDRNSSICESEPEVCVPAKKQRIAHVPKSEKTSMELENPPAKKPRQSAKQIGKKISEKSPKCPKPNTRSSILNEKKSDEVDTKSCEKQSIVENRKIVRSNSPVGAIEVCRQERTRAKRNTPMDSPLPLDQPKNGKLEDPSSPKITVTSSITESPSATIIGATTEILESPDNRDNPEDPEDPEKVANISREIFNDHSDPEKSANLSENITSPSEDNKKLDQSLVDKTPKSIGTKLSEISDVDGVKPSETESRRISAIEDNCSSLLEESNAAIESDSSEAPDEQPISKVPLTDSSQIVEDRKAISDESEVRSAPREPIEAPAELALPTETGTVHSPASPASEEIDSPLSPVSCSSLEKFPTDPAAIALSPIRSPLYSNVKLAEPETLSPPESADEKSSINAAKNLDFKNTTESPNNIPDLTNAAKNLDFTNPTESSKDIPNLTNAAKNLDFTNPTESSNNIPDLTKSILFQKLTEPSSTIQLDSSKKIMSLPRISDDARTAHPENTQRQFSNHHLPAQPVTRPVSQTKIRQQRLSINKTGLQIKPQVVSITTLPNDSSTRSKETKVAENHVDVDISANTTSATTSSNYSAEKSSDVPKPCDITENVSSVPKSTNIAENRAEVEFPANTTSLNNSAEKSSDVAKICDATKNVSSVSKSTKIFENRAEVEIPANTTSSNNSAEKSSEVPKICNMTEKVSTKKSGRVPVVYDPSLQEDVDRELDAEIDSSPQFFVDTSDEKSKKKKKKSPANDRPAATKVVKELRSRQVLSGPATAAIQRNSPATKNSKDETVDRIPYSRHIVCPGTLLGRHLGALQRKSKVTKERRAAAMELFTAAEKTAKAELDKLVESEEWTSELHQSVIARLREIHSRRTVAKAIVDLLVERAALGEALDRTYTPPAPVMTKSQQRIATLLNGLDRDGIMPGVTELVQDGIEFTLFRLSHTQEATVVEGLVRMFTAMARMRKDRERVRILCCDSLYCLARTAFMVINVVLSVWPEVFPMHGSGDELPNCMAHLIKLEQGPKTLALKRLITAYYNYPQSQAPSSVIMKGLMQALQKNYTDDLEAAVLLLAKREGPDWAYDNIINGGLMKMVDDASSPSIFKALSLLGFIVRTFPLADPLGVMENVCHKLYKIIESGEATPDQQEGVVSALLSLTRRVAQFEKITNIVFNWRPTQTMRTRTTEQLNGLFKMRALGFWTMHNQLRLKNINTSSDKNDGDEKES